MDQHQIAVHVLRKITDCADGKVCPAVIRIDSQPDHAAIIGKISGTPGVVYIPAELIPEAVDLPAAPGWPGYKMMTGDPITDPQEAAVLAEHIGPGEAALLVRNDQIPEVLQHAA